MCVDAGLGRNGTLAIVGGNSTKSNSSDLLAHTQRVERRVELAKVLDTSQKK